MNGEPTWTCRGPCGRALTGAGYIWTRTTERRLYRRPRCRACTALDKRASRKLSWQLGAELLALLALADGRPLTYARIAAILNTESPAIGQRVCRLRAAGVRIEGRPSERTRTGHLSIRGYWLATVPPDEWLEDVCREMHRLKPTLTPCAEIPTNPRLMRSALLAERRAS